MLETKKESLRDNISEDEMEKKKAESADMRTQQHISDEGRKISRKLKKKKLKEIAEKTGNDLSTIETLSKRLIDDPISVMYDQLDDRHEKTIEEQIKQISELEEWFMNESVENRKLKMENELLRERLDSIRIQTEISTLTQNLGDWVSEDRLSH